MAKIKAKINENKTKKKVNKKKTNKEIKKELIKDTSFDGNEDIRKFVIILIIMIAIVIGIYVVSKVVVDKRETKDNKKATVEIDYDVTIVGTILNRPYDEYYVLVYDENKEESKYYINLYNEYKKKEDTIKMYYCNLANKLNEKYKAEESNKNIKSVDDFKFKDITLLKIKNGKVVSYIEDTTKIESVLQ